MSGPVAQSTCAGEVVECVQDGLAFGRSNPTASPGGRRRDYRDCTSPWIPLASGDGHPHLKGRGRCRFRGWVLLGAQPLCVSKKAHRGRTEDSQPAASRRARPKTTPAAAESQAYALGAHTAYRIPVTPSPSARLCFRAPIRRICALQRACCCCTPPPTPCDPDAPCLLDNIMPSLKMSTASDASTKAIMSTNTLCAPCGQPSGAATETETAEASHAASMCTCCCVAPHDHEPHRLGGPDH
eukprot:353069-Chlamydomonas_euryale.AAC.15